MRPSRERRAVAAAMRCYSTRWRKRHGDEATMLASKLIDDGVPWWSVALSFLGGATRERVFGRPSMRFGTTSVAITLFVAAAPLALFASLDPAGASGVNIVIVITKPGDAMRQLESAFASHHLKITVTERLVPAELVGSILSVNTRGVLSAHTRDISELNGRCIGGTSSCIDGLVLPRNFSGTALVTIGRAALLLGLHGR